MGTLLDRMEPLLAAMPAVKSPEGHVHFKNKLLWTAGILILYFVMTNIPLWGLDPNSMDLFQYYRALLAGASGSLIQLGIGPIVTASIVLQLLKGADILHIDTAEVRGQVLYMGLQKLLIFVMIVIEALPNLVGGFLLPDPVVADMFFGGSLTARNHTTGIVGDTPFGKPTVRYLQAAAVFAPFALASVPAYWPALAPPTTPPILA